MRALLLVALTACASFESPDIVLDLRVLAMAADVPDQVIDIDLSQGEPNPQALLDQLVPSTMCALVGDPTEDRRLRYSMTLCRRCDEGCCEESNVRIALAEGLLDDPELAVPAPTLCATVEPNSSLLGLLLEVFDDDVFQGIAGLDYGVVLKVGGEDADPALDQIGGKTLRVSARIPAEVTANTNPTVDGFEAEAYLPDGTRAEAVALPMGRCVDQTAPLTLVPTQKVRITPIEPANVRETYVVPTIDGMGATFTESLTYQWLAGAGGLSPGSSGGGRDISGTPAPLFTEYRAPRAEDLDGPTDIPLWIVQRDERLGAAWFESCVRVVP